MKRETIYKKYLLLLESEEKQGLLDRERKDIEKKVCRKLDQIRATFNSDEEFTDWLSLKNSNIIAL